jgi:hypothetical protein
MHPATSSLVTRSLKRPTTTPKRISRLATRLPCSARQPACSATTRGTTRRLHCGWRTLRAGAGPAAHAAGVRKRRQASNRHENVWGPMHLTAAAETDGHVVHIDGMMTLPMCGYVQRPNWCSRLCETALLFVIKHRESKCCVTMGFNASEMINQAVYASRSAPAEAA